MIRILIVDDLNSIRQEIKTLLAPSLQLEIVGLVQDGNSAIEQVKNLRPDIVLIDIETSKMSSTSTTKQIAQQYPETKVLILSTHQEREYVLEALQAGAAGYLLKETLAENLEQTIYLVNRGHSQIQSKLLQEILAQPAQSELVLTAQQSTHHVSSASAQNGNLSHHNHQLLTTSTLRLQPNSENIAHSEFEKTTTKAAQTKTGNMPDVSTAETSAKHDLQPTSDRQAKATLTNMIFSQFRRWWWLSSLIIIPLVWFGAKIAINSRDNEVAASVASKTQDIPQAVAALGYLEPQGEVIQLSAPAFAEGARVDQLLVTRGERVKTGQIVAILDSRDRLQATWQQIQQEEILAQNSLDRVKAGAKQGDILAQKANFQGTKAELNGQINIQQATIGDLEAQWQGEINAQKATIKRLQAELKNATKECQRYESLYADGAVSSSEQDRICLQQATAKELLTEAEANLVRIDRTLNQQINQAKANLERTKITLSNQINEAEASFEAIAEVRSVDVNVAQTELKVAKAAVARAKADLELAYVKAPMEGKILKINTRAGEIVDNSQGIVEIGNTDNMYVIAEVYETDIERIRLGQTATITSNGVFQKLTGTVKDLGLQIGTKDVLGTDPVADADARVVEVKIGLKPEDSQKVANLTNLQVNVIINTNDH